MSLILDALKRAERERQADPPPASVRDVVAMPGRAPAAPRPGVRIVSVLVFGGGLALAALLLWDAFRAPAPPAPAAVAAPAPQAEPQAQQVVKARPAPPPTTAVPGTEAVGSLDDLSDEPELDAAAEPAPAPKQKKQKPVPPTAIATRPAPPPATSPPTELRSDRASQAQTPPPAPLPPAPVAAQPAQPQALPPSQAQTQTQPMPPPAPEPAPQQQGAPAEIPPALTQPAPLKKFREMPPDYRADFPALRIEIHVYEKDPRRRFVMVNGRKYREGERLSEGPTLIEIVSDGIVLEYRGEKVLFTLGR
jgi:general secretion pathway protein B